MLIAIEGIDGSGKGTQASALTTRLLDFGLDAEIIRFPQYETTFFGKEVGRYLNGEYGSLEEVHPKFSSLLYALDRFQALEAIKKAESQGKILICDRYTGSNMAHQAARVGDDDKDSMISWIKEVEFNVLRIPVPDIVVFLDINVSQSQKLVGKKEKRSYTDQSHDLHEASGDHLEKALKNFRQLACDLGWQRICCTTSDGVMRTPEDITDEIFQFVKTKIVNG
jgi:dTMP kinase